jgi:4-aminobutyrate aminotransferase-like enzyme
MWLDFSSGVLVTNAGHGRTKIVQAIVKTAQKPLIHHYCFPSEERTELASKLVGLAPAPINRVFLLTTGSEACECALKLARTYGQSISPKKIAFVSFTGGFHGRTLGSQMIGGVPALKSWIPNPDKDILIVPFPGDFRHPDTSFEVFERTLEKAGVSPENVCGVISETYQGAGANFMPVEYAKKLRKWCTAAKALLIWDEIQAGFGRTGTFWGFEHYEDAVPDLMCLGKGISGGMPLAAVMGRQDIMDLYGPGEMTSTHTGNPICAASAVASIEVILEDKLVERSREVGKVLQAEVRRIAPKHREIGHVDGKGLVAALQMVVPGTKDPDHPLAHRIVELCFQRGLLMFAPVGFGGGALKIAPPLCIHEDQVQEAMSVLETAIADACAERRSAK